MKDCRGDGGWSPYLAGALVGVLAIVSVVATARVTGRGSYLGASTTFVRAAGLLERAFAAGRVNDREYYSKVKPRVDWQFMLVVGIFLGALLSSLTDGSFKGEGVPPAWSARFGRSIGKRAWWAIAGGMAAMIGARMADGCPSGHGLSGLMQLSVSGIVALVLFFATGVGVAHLVYGGREHE